MKVDEEKFLIAARSIVESYEDDHKASALFASITLAESLGGNRDVAQYLDPGDRALYILALMVMRAEEEDE